MFCRDFSWRLAPDVERLEISQNQNMQNDAPTFSIVFTIITKDVWNFHGICVHASRFFLSISLDELIELVVFVICLSVLFGPPSFVIRTVHPRKRKYKQTCFVVVVAFLLPRLELNLTLIRSWLGHHLMTICFDLVNIRSFFSAPRSSRSILFWFGCYRNTWQKLYSVNRMCILQCIWKKLLRMRELAYYWKR